MKLSGFKNRLLKKIKSTGGFTLVELLCASTVMVIVAGIMVLGIRLGSKSYNETVSVSDAKELCSVLTKTLNDELRTSGTLYVAGTTDDDGKRNVLGVYSKSFGGGENDNLKTFYVGSDGQLYFGNSSNTLGSINVLGKKAYSAGSRLDLTIKVKNDATNKTNTYTVTMKICDSSGNELTEYTFDVKQLNYHEPIVVTESNG